MGVSELLQQLRDDKTSGATTLAEQAVEIVELFVASQVAPDPEKLAASLETLVGEILTAQPSMAVMIELARRALDACPADLPLAAGLSSLQESLAAFRQELRGGTQALCLHALALFPPDATVLTYSNSATVTAALRHAVAHGRLGRVLLSEARPAYDGRQQARALTEAGISVEYCIDMALFEGLAAADVVIVGADAVFPDTFVNKVGTHALAQLAHVRGVPCFALSASNKFLPAGAAGLLRIVEQPSDEVWPDVNDGVRVRNRYFEETPLALLRGIVTDRGMQTAETVSAQLRQHALSPALQRLAAKRLQG